jgi:hypothetical protein
MLAQSLSRERHVVHVEDVPPAVLHLPDGVTVNTVDLAATPRGGLGESGSASGF